MSTVLEDSVAFLHIVDAWLPPIEFQVAVLDAEADCVSHRFNKVLLSLCGCIHHSSVTVSHAVSPEDSKVTHIQPFCKWTSHRKHPKQLDNYYIFVHYLTVVLLFLSHLVTVLH